MCDLIKMSIIDIQSEISQTDLSTLMRLTGRQTVDIDFENLTYTVSDRKQGEALNIFFFLVNKIIKSNDF